jgi:phosphopantetheinyl transferase (holo-ACP synthase)
VDRALLEIEVVREGTAPSLRLAGGTRAAADRLGLVESEISLSHAGEYAVASVVLRGTP